MDDLDDIIEEFLVESYENIDRVDIELVELEERPDSADLLASIFRNLHTIKGTAGFFGFSKLEKVSHAGENLLSLLRSGELALSTEIADALLSTVDAIRSMLDCVRADGTDGEEAHTGLIATLHQLADPNRPPGPVADQSPADDGPTTDAATDAAEATEPGTASASPASTPPADEPGGEPAEPTEVDPANAPDVVAAEADATAATAASETTNGNAPAGDIPEPDPPAGDIPEPDPPARDAPEPGLPEPGPSAEATNGDTPHEVATPTRGAPSPTPSAAAATDDADADGSAQSRSRVTDTTIRVDVGLLDRLMNLVGELVLARNQVLQYQAVAAEPTFQTTSQQLDLITTELQEGVMKTRMQPIGNVWAKLPRVVRDLAAACSKKVRIEMEGEDTELDKTILEAIKDPLTHLVRNSVDHGLETPQERLAAGKSEVGLLKLRALHEGGQVIIEIIDDGAGLNLERIRSKAIDTGVVSPERAAMMSDRDIGNLIFRPGFSTAAAVTNVSGRGVGMDVVKTNVEKIGGSLEIQSEPGLGTTLTIKIPLTLAIIPALIVSCDTDRYLISQINLVEVLHIDGSSGDTKIEMAGDAPVLRLRGKLLPVVHLRDVLELPTVDASQLDGINIAVLHADGCQFGLVVDQINDTEEIVVKPLSPHLKGLGAFAGTTIMGDGAVSLILDATGVARLGGVLKDQNHGSGLDDGSDRDRRASTEMVLVCTVGDARIGIPLALVSRLEELPIAQIERASGHDVIQYRDRLLRLIYLDEMLQSRATRDDDREKLQVLVYETDEGFHGLVVGDIVDVFETDLSVGEPADRSGLRMTGIIGRRVTDLLDIDEIIARATGRPLAGSGKRS